MQDKLGAQQDAYMANKRLGALAADPASGLPPVTLFLMGRLAEHHERITADARRTVAKSWRKVRGRRWKALRARLGRARRSRPSHPTQRLPRCRAVCRRPAQTAVETVPPASRPLESLSSRTQSATWSC